MVRIATEEDFEFVKTAWEVCFDDPGEFVEWNFSNNYSKDDTIIAEYNGTPAGVMQIRPYNLILNNEKLSCRYVSGVGVMPKYRGLGLVREMFNFAFPYMRELNCDISLLMPAVEGMYEKFGYKKICGRKTCIISSMPPGEKITTIGLGLISRLDKLYRENMKNKKMYILRSQTDWERILTDLIEISKGAVLFTEKGYALIYPKEDKFEVVEKFGTETGGEEISGMPVMGKMINSKKLLTQMEEKEDVFLNLLL